MPTRRILTLLTIALAASATPGIADDERQQRILDYRQSAWTLVGANFGPMYQMVDGKREWDDEEFARFAADLERLTHIDHLRGYPPGSEGGRTRARPVIWEEFDEFSSLLDDLRARSEALADVAGQDDRDAKMAAVGEVGKACKACHDRFRAKDYLN
jgi:cytochrome c556